MIIKMTPGASDAQVDAVEDRIRHEGYEPRTIRGVGMSVIAVIGKRPEYLIDKILSMSGVDQCIPIEKPYKLAARDFQSGPTEIPLGEAVLGSQDITVMAGPCTVETREQLLTTARGVKAHGAHVLRGGAFKPRSSPYAFQGLGEDGLKLLDEARAVSGLPIITEVMEPGTVDVVQRYADVLQIGARNCQNYPLLREVGKARKPVMLKRGPSVTIDEWIMAAEYVLHGGNMQVMMCERGIKTFENYTRNTLDLSAIPAIKRLTHLPVIVDPSHGTGKWHLVRSMCLASVAAGADGVLIEVHPTPDTALCDGAQSLTIENFAVAATEIARVADAVGRRVPGFEANGTFVGGGSSAVAWLMPVSSGASSVALSSGERVVRAVPKLSGAIEVPGDKSITHRAVMFNALSDGVATVTGAGLGGDCLSTAGAMRALGAQVRRRWEHGVLTDDLRHEPDTGADVREGAVLQVRGAGGVGLTEPVDVIDAGNSGTTARLLSGVLAAQPFFSVLTGDESLRSRPMGRVITPLRMMGARIEARARGSLLPFAVAPGALRGISYSLPVASAQLKSALILAGLYADGETVIDSPEASRDHTERLLIAQGAAVTSDASGLSVRVRPTGRALRAVDVAVPGDISSAAFWLVAACIHPHARVTVGNVGVNPSRTGIVDALRAMGATIEVTNERVVGGEPVADLTASSAHLRGVGIGGAIVPRLVDELPVLAVAAAVADGTTTISDAAELRVKESDRIATVAEGLKALGVSVTERPDGMVIAGRGTVAGGEVSSHGDHRIAMAFAVAGLVATGGVIIGGAAAVDISYPAFWPTLARIAPGSVRES